jgi:hypothetical protein
LQFYQRNSRLRSFKTDRPTAFNKPVTKTQLLTGDLLHHSGNLVPGWASTILPIRFLSSAQLLSIGVVGEYVGKIYLETKRRPRFIIQRTTFD